MFILLVHAFLLKFEQQGECFTVVATRTAERFYWKGRHKGATGLFPADHVVEIDDGGAAVAPEPTPHAWSKANERRIADIRATLFSAPPHNAIGLRQQSSGSNHDGMQQLQQQRRRRRRRTQSDLLSTSTRTAVTAVAGNSDRISHESDVARVTSSNSRILLSAIRQSVQVQAKP